MSFPPVYLRSGVSPSVPRYAALILSCMTYFGLDNLTKLTVSACGSDDAPPT